MEEEGKSSKSKLDKYWLYIKYEDGEKVHEKMG